MCTMWFLFNDYFCKIANADFESNIFDKCQIEFIAHVVDALNVTWCVRVFNCYWYLTLLCYCKEKTQNNILIFHGNTYHSEAIGYKASTSTLYLKINGKTWNYIIWICIIAEIENVIFISHLDGVWIVIIKIVFFFNFSFKTGDFIAIRYILEKKTNASKIVFPWILKRMRFHMQRYIGPVSLTKLYIHN